MSEHDDGSGGLGGRLSLLPAGELTEDQRRLYDRLVAVRIRNARDHGFTAQLEDGRLVGPFNGLLHVPDIGEGLLDWADAIARSSLSPQVRQVLILVTGVAWDSAYEVYAHTAGARHAGISESTLAAIRSGRHPADATADQQLAAELAVAVTADHKVSDDLWDRSVGTFGTEGTLAAVHLIGQYMVISALLNTVRVPVPPA